MWCSARRFYQACSLSLSLISAKRNVLDELSQRQAEVCPNCSLLKSQSESSTVTAVTPAARIIAVPISAVVFIFAHAIRFNVPFAKIKIEAVAAAPLATAIAEMVFTNATGAACTELAETAPAIAAPERVTPRCAKTFRNFSIARAMRLCAASSRMPSNAAASGPCFCFQVKAQHQQRAVAFCQSGHRGFQMWRELRPDGGGVRVVQGGLHISLLFARVAAGVGAAHLGGGEPRGFVEPAGEQGFLAQSRRLAREDDLKTACVTPCSVAVVAGAAPRDGIDEVEVPPHEFGGRRPRNGRGRIPAPSPCRSRLASTQLSLPTANVDKSSF